MLNENGDSCGLELNENSAGFALIEGWRLVGSVGLELEDSVG